MSDRKYKVVFIGDGNVGKSALMERIAYDKFSKEAEATVASAIFEIILERDNQSVTVMLWDTAGSEKYRALTKYSINDTDVIGICFAKNDPTSLENIKSWADFANDGNYKDKPAIIYIKTKEDLETGENGTKIISDQDIKAVLDPLGIQDYITTSALNSEGIELLKNVICEKCLERSAIQAKSNIDIGRKDKEKGKEGKKGCC